MGRLTGRKDEQKKKPKHIAVDVKLNVWFKMNIEQIKWEKEGQKKRERDRK